MSTEPARLRQTIRGESPQFFETDGVDDIVAVTMALATELWVTRERLAGLESLIRNKGVLSDEEIADYRPDDAEAERLAADRAAFLERIFFAITQRAGEDPAEVPEHLRPETPPRTTDG